MRLSVHKMFLTAPDSVLEAIVHYIQGKTHERRKHALTLRVYIQEHLAQNDYSHLLDPRKLVKRGTHYDLDAIYQDLNRTYFNDQLSLEITWYGRKMQRPKRRVTFGQYLDGLRLIKIHRMMDDPFFPSYFVEFIVYHEMLHAVVPGSAGRGDRFLFHTKEFKRREKEFAEYAKALTWEKKNKGVLFSHGWS